MVATDAHTLVWTFDTPVVLTGPASHMEWRNGAGPWDTFDGWTQTGPTEITTVSAGADFALAGSWRILGIGPITGVRLVIGPQGPTAYTPFPGSLVVAVVAAAEAVWFFDPPSVYVGPGDCPELEVFKGGVWHSPTGIVDAGGGQIVAAYAVGPFSAGDPWRINAPTSGDLNPNPATPQTGTMTL